MLTATSDIPDSFYQRAQLTRFGVTLSGITFIGLSFDTRFQVCVFMATAKQPKPMKIVSDA